MKIATISKLKKQAIKEAQIEVNKIFKKYSIEIQNEIAKQIPKGQLLYSGNGMCHIADIKTGAEISSGNAWSRTAAYNPKMDFIAELQYGTDSNDIQGYFSLPTELNGKMPKQLQPERLKERG